ncbi:hypothetical protein K1719_046532 [Acacia pycnantha]|nr:hypothetical protein K1719_046532 [Acacia pycnantha]
MALDSHKLIAASGEPRDRVQFTEYIQKNVALVSTLMFLKATRVGDILTLQQSELSELVSVEGYSDWIQMVAEFTLKSLQSWQWASNSVYYLLGLWSRLVSSVPYLKGDAPSLLDEFVPKITESFITSRFNYVQDGIPDDLSENPLDNAELLQDQLDCFPQLCRFQQKKTKLGHQLKWVF